MRKRILVLALVLLLAGQAMAFSASAADYTDAYNYLVDYAKSGYYDEEYSAYYAGFYMDSAQTTIFEVYYDMTENTVESCIISNGQLIISIVFPANGSSPYDAYVAYGSGIEGDAKVYPASYTEKSNLTFTAYTGNANYKTQLQQTLNMALPDILEITRGILLDGGYTLKDLGFNAFDRHTIHAFDNGKITTQATCGANGVFTYTCRICGYKETESIPATGNHSWDGGKVTTQPTCVKEGVKTFTCTVCKQTRTEKVAATGKHTWDEGKVTTQPTCVKEGVKTFTCTVCNQTRTEKVAATGIHSYIETGAITQPTCVDTGVMGLKCTVCGKTDTKVMPALGHAWKVTEILAEPTEDVHGTASYTCSRCGETKEADYCAGEIFIDMPGRKNWAHNSIDWAFFNDITSGTSYNTFKPKKTCTRAEIVTFLWRTAGCPEPEETELHFTDVKKGSYYEKAVIWAVSEGITKGTSETTFKPKKTCTRADVVTFLWRAAGSPQPETGEDGAYTTSFTDVKAHSYYEKAVAWAVANDVTSGTTPTTFKPKSGCTRAQIVTFLYRYCMIPKPTDPTVPTEPTQPTQPTDPTIPTEPTQPTQPTDPTVPTEPTQPTQPTDPTVPTEPTQPAQPTDPTVPTEPTQPTVPTQPIPATEP